MAAAVRVTLDRAHLQAVLAQLREAAREGADLAARKVALDVVADVARTVPVDTGRLRAGWRLAADEMEPLEESDTHVLYAVENAVEYALHVERGTRHTPPGNHLAVALETNRRRVRFDSSVGGARGLIRARLQELAK